MNVISNLFDWILSSLPSVRLSEDHNDPEALSDGNSPSPPSITTSTTASSYPPLGFFNRASQSSLRSQRSSPPRSSLDTQQTQPTPNPQDLHSVERSKGWDRERERERERQRERERDQDRQRILALERENALLSQRVSQLELDLRSAKQTIHTLNLVAAPHLPLPPSLPQFPPPPSDPLLLKATYEKLLGTYNLTQRAVLERTEEVSSLKSYLSKNDEVSGAQILQALRDLNAEIIQLAASVAEEFSSSMDRHINMAKPSDMDLVSSVLGPVLTNLLATRDHEGDPTLVQFAIQAWEVVCIGKVLDSFCFGLPAEVDQAFLRIFDYMHRSEPQPITSRWRALAHAHARALISPPASNSNGSRPPQSPFLTLAETNLRGLLAILAISGCTDPKGTHVQLFRERFGHILLRISERVERISVVMKEGIMSSNFEILWVGTRRKGFVAEDRKGQDGLVRYDENKMDNVFLGHGSEKGGVLCTVEFGLMCVRQAGDGMGMSSQQQLVQQHHRKMSSGDINALAKMNGNGVANGAVNGNGYANGYGHTNGVSKPHMNGFSDSLQRSLLLKPKILLESVVEFL